MAESFVVADLHLGHEKACIFLDDQGNKTRPWNSVAEMDEALIEGINAEVRPHDRLYILGDVAMRCKAMSALYRAHGKKVLVKGNHDTFELREYLKYFEDIRAAVVKGRFVLTHIPVHAGSLDRWRGNVHGHLHSKRVLLPDGKPDPRYLCVSVEQTGFRPIPLDEAFGHITRALSSIG